MKRFLSILFIGGYLSALGIGIVCHGMHTAEGAHPLMYFVVWDMFCGYSAFASRTHLVAEGESGQFYRLTPAPWGEYHPYGDLGRQHYDAFGNFGFRLADNVLRHTAHEPIRSVYVIEEAWAKKYNLPSQVWAHHFEEPLQPHHYFHPVAAYTVDGRVTMQRPMWMDYQASLCVTDNPRLLAESRRSQPMFALTPNQRSRNSQMQPLWERAFAIPASIQGGTP